MFSPIFTHRSLLFFSVILLLIAYGRTDTGDTSFTDTECPGSSFTGSTLKVKLEENLLSPIHSFRISGQESADSEWHSLGTISSKLFSITNVQTWYDPNGAAIASSSIDALTNLFETAIPVEDCNGEQIGRATQQIVNTGLSSVMLYSIRSATGEIITSKEAPHSGIELFDQVKK